MEEVAALRARVAELERVNRRLARSRDAGEDLDGTRAEWESTFGAVRDSIMVLDGAFKIVQANPATSRFLGKPLEEIVGKTCWHAVHGTDKPPKGCPLQKAHSSKNHEDADLYVPEKDIWIEVSVDPIMDDQGHIDRVVHIIRDITDRKNAEEQMMNLAKFPSENPYPVFRVSGDGTILYANASSETFLRNNETGIGQPAPQRWRRVAENALASGSIGRMEAKHKRRVLAFRAVPITDGGYANFHGIDITDRKNAEQRARDAQQRLIEQKLREKEHVEEELAKVRDELVRTTRLAAIGQVSASIAHDLRNPLGSVRNASFFLRRRVSQNDPKASEHLKIIDHEIARADQIIGNLLEMAQPKAPRKQEVDLGEIVTDVLSHAKHSGGIRCGTSLVPDPFVVLADVSQLRQVIGNIVSNAVEAMRGHGDFPS